MQINNTPTPSFQGLYIIKGTANKVEQATHQIRRACSNPTVQEALREEASMAGKKYQLPFLVIKDFFDCIHCGLVDVYDSMQPLVQNIIATNDDTKIITNYIKETHGDIDTNDNPEEAMKKLFSSVVSKLLKHEQKKEEYMLAQEKFNKGYPKPLLDIISETQVEAKKVLNDILKPHGIEPSSLKVIDAENVLECIENETFDFTTGKYYKRIREYV